MPTINVLFNDLELLLGQALPRESEKLTDLLAFVKGEVESFEGEELSIEIKDGNRPDLWGIEGIARALRGALGIEEGLKPYYAVGSSGVDIRVDRRLWDIRPYIACSVVRAVDLSDEVIRGFMHLQDKLDQTYGRKRSRTSIGLYDFGRIRPPLRYVAVEPTEVSFIPLESSRAMNLKEILEVHPKGVEYGHIVKAFKEWPLLVDAEDHVLSFPPIINSVDLGKITEETKDILIEVTGTDHQTVLNTLTLVTTSVADRGGQIFSSRIVYPYTALSLDITPLLTPSEVDVEIQFINEVLGFDLSMEDAIGLMKRARYDPHSINGEWVNIKIPCYRVDIMHPVDVVEDVAIMYGYNNITPRWPQLVTFGEISSLELLCDSVREILIGLGFQEILSFSMTSPHNLFGRMNCKPDRVVEVANPINERFTCLRSWLMPSLMEFLSANTHVSYPQRIFEVSECAVLDRFSRTGVTDVRKLACISIHSKASYSEIKAILDAFALNIDRVSTIEEFDHGAFLEGRAGKILMNGQDVGFLGEIHPHVLKAWALENPAVGLEIDINKIFDSIKCAG